MSGVPGRMAADPAARLERARRALDGLSVGDALGERFFGARIETYRRISAGEVPEVPRGPWRYTDDTEMALAVVEALERSGSIDPDWLARAFARRYAARPDRGYGSGAHHILGAIVEGMPWRLAAAAAFDGKGSLGNGAAMRAPPLGAYFADDFDACVENARLSAVVTHAHPEGQAGAIAVAVATAFAAAQPAPGESLLEAAHARTPPGETRDGIAKVLALPEGTIVEAAAFALGNGSRVTAPDTVPFALWCAARHLESYESALWAAVSALGDIDTNCAIVGGIVAASGAPVPAEWLASREPLV